MKKRITSLLLTSITAFIYSCSSPYDNMSLGYVISNYREITKLQNELNDLKKLHGKICAPKEIAYAEVYLEALKGIKVYDRGFGVYKRVNISNNQRINYFTKAREYIALAREKIYGDKDGDGLPCFVEADIGTNPNIPDTKAYDRRRIESIKRKLLKKKRRYKTENSPIKQKNNNRKIKPLKLTARIHFDLNKATIKRSYLPYMNVVIRYLKAHPELKVKIIGYTDDIGSKRYNDKLAYKRALAIKNYLVNHGINPSRIYIEGRGKTDYLVDNKTSIDRFTNRRAEFFIMQATE